MELYPATVTSRGEYATLELEMEEEALERTFHRTQIDLAGLTRSEHRKLTKKGPKIGRQCYVLLNDHYLVHMVFF